MTRTPLLIIGGYLGAGKTTLIRNLLTQNHGRRLLVLVNDFGAINIDAALIAEAQGETVALTNGCVCCAMTGDLYFAIGDALDRDPRPDAIIIESSGVGDPARIAAVALAEPDLLHAGVVTLADVEQIVALLADPQIGPQVAGQIGSADLVVLSRTDRSDPGPAMQAIAALTGSPVISAPHGQIDPEVLFGLDPSAPVSGDAPDHGTAFVTWAGAVRSGLPSAAIEWFLRRPMDGLYRLKGWISDETGTREVHRVGDRIDLRPMDARAGSQLVAIGPAGRFHPDALEQRWRALTET